MILLDATTKSLQIVLGGAVATNQLPFSASYVDVEATTWGVTGMAENDGQSNGATAVTVVAAPGSGDRRQVKTLAVHNADTANVTITVRVNNNGTFRTIFKATLATLENLYYGDSGWQVLAADGRLKIDNNV